MSRCHDCIIAFIYILYNVHYKLRRLDYVGRRVLVIASQLENISTNIIWVRGLNVLKLSKRGKPCKDKEVCIYGCSIKVS